MTDEISAPHADIINRLLEEYRRMLSAEAEDLAPDWPKFRILLLGRVGVGKSTLSSSILAIPYGKRNSFQDLSYNPIVQAVVM
jgi:predicted GTPase